MNKRFLPLKTAKQLDSMLILLVCAGGFIAFAFVCLAISLLVTKIISLF